MVSPRKEAKRSTPRDPVGYWNAHFQRVDASPEELLVTITDLRQTSQFVDVEAALRAYLTHRTKSAEPWMYEGLALAIELNKGNAQEVKTYLGYAADLALRVKEPGQLVHVADALYVREMYDRAAPLIDLAAQTIPHRGEPLLMSINLAQKTRDPKRMGDAIEALLSLGWPGADPKGRMLDEQVRRDARTQAETLAASLREDGRSDEADALIARLPGIEARDLYARLTWTGTADLDLIVEEPLGATARYETPRTVFGGAILKNGDHRNSEEIYSCPRGFDGTYTFKVETIFSDPDQPVHAATLEIISHEGTAGESREVRTFDLRNLEPITFALKGGRRRKVLPFIAPGAVIRGPADAAKSGPSEPAPASPR